MTGEWIETFERSTGGRLASDARAFLVGIAKHAPTSKLLWGERPGARFERLAVEGGADRPTLVCYFRDDVKRPGTPLAFEWPLFSVDESFLQLGRLGGEFRRAVGRGWFCAPDEPGARRSGACLMLAARALQTDIGPGIRDARVLGYESKPAAATSPLCVWEELFFDGLADAVPALTCPAE